MIIYKATSKASLQYGIYKAYLKKFAINGTAKV